MKMVNALESGQEEFSFINGESPARDGRKDVLRAFLPSNFVYFPLPLKSTDKSVSKYEREYNNFKMVMKGDKGIPGGKIGRELLAFFTTEAVKNGSSGGDIELNFDSLTQLNSVLGIKRGSSFETTTDMIEKFAYTSVSFFRKRNDVYRKGEIQGYLTNGERADLAKRAEEKNVIQLKEMYNMFFFKKYGELSIEKDKARSGEAISVNIVLSEAFVKMVSEHPIKINWNIYKEIKSSLEKDMYVWFVYRNNGRFPAEGIHIPRNKIIGQFGFGQKDTGKGLEEKRVYQYIMEAIRNIKKKYLNEMDFEEVKDCRGYGNGILLKKSNYEEDNNALMYAPLFNW